MTYRELRTRLRAEGFINFEISILHHQYLMVRALGVPDDDIVFDRDHGVLIHQRSADLLDRSRGKHFKVDTANDIAYEVGDERSIH